MLRTLVTSALLLFVLGCSYHPQPVSVYGKSGVPYTAPTVCAALTKCLQSEQSCFYDTTVLSTVTGTETTACKEVKK